MPAYRHSNGTGTTGCRSSGGAISSQLDSFSTIGVILLMFIAGMETDTKQMRQVGVAASVSASAGVVIPFIAGTAFSYALGYSLLMSLFLGTLLTATSVSISAQTLKELGKLNTKEGTTILGAAVIDDVLGLIVLSLILAFTLGQNPLWSILKMALYFPTAYLWATTASHCSPVGSHACWRWRLVSVL